MFKESSIYLWVHKNSEKKMTQNNPKSLLGLKVILVAHRFGEMKSSTGIYLQNLTIRILQFPNTTNYYFITRNPATMSGIYKVIFVYA